MDNPVTREEQYLAKIAGDDIIIPSPVTREEKYLAKMAGEDVTVPKAVTRIEHYYEGVIKVIEESVKPEPITITENGVYDEQGKAYNPVNVNVPTYGADDVGKVVTTDGQDYALTAQSSQNITANGTYDTTLKNEVVVNVSGGGDARWQEIGYPTEPAVIQEGIDYAKQVALAFNANRTYNGNRNLRFMPYVDMSVKSNLDNMWNGCYALVCVPSLDTSNVTSMKYCFQYCYSLQSVGTIDTSNVTDMRDLFYQCYNLTDVPVLNMAKVTVMFDMFSSCPNLSNDSLNNIMASLITATSYTGTKSLSAVGLSNAQKSTCQTLSNYQAFLDAGWTA